MDFGSVPQLHDGSVSVPPKVPLTLALISHTQAEYSRPYRTSGVNSI